MLRRDSSVIDHNELTRLGVEHQVDRCLGVVIGSPGRPCINDWYEQDQAAKHARKFVHTVTHDTWSFICRLPSVTRGATQEWWKLGRFVPAPERRWRVLDDGPVGGIGIESQCVAT